MLDALFTAPAIWFSLPAFVGTSIFLLRFITLHDQLTDGQVNEPWLREVESRDNLFPEIDCAYWR